MTEPWLKVTLPVTGGSTYRTRQVLERVVEALFAALGSRLEPRDITGDGKRETFCNYLVMHATRSLGCEVPTDALDAAGHLHLYRVQEQLAWLVGEGREHGWSECTAEAAVARAALGYPTVVAWVPQDESSGHIAVVMPNRDRDEGVHIAQAGASCFAYGTLGRGFGARGPLFYFTHP